MKITPIKRKKSLHICLLLLVIMPAIILSRGVECYAKSDSEEENVTDAIDGIIEDFQDALPDGAQGVADIDNLTKSLGVKNILSGVFSVLLGQGGALLSFTLSLIGVTLIGSLASSLRSDISPVAARGIGVVASVMMLDKLMFLFEGVTSSLTEISEFFAAVIPITLAVNSLGISPTTASTQAIGMGVTLGAYSFIANSLFVPTVSAIFITSAASSVDPLFERIAKGIKGAFLSVMGIFTVLVGATFSLQTAISVSSDSALMRSARYAVVGSIPIVGNAVSGALALVSGGAVYARGIVGGGAIAVIISLILSPLVTLIAYRICLKVGVFFASVCSGDGLCGVISSFLGALDTLIAVYALSAVIYIVEMVAFLKGGTGIA